ncbi:MAG: CoA-binding protein [Proteobacteria bacterium]|nr:CoA-binding protein [Pseudomonadota bacterium]MBU1741271.1 CoA-binding protein [Pseudomonadota bacterium]
MKHFLEPASVALIGVSRRSGPGSYNLMENMLEYGFPGKIIPINPQADEILGVKAWPNVQAAAQPIDLAVISLPRDLVLTSVAECVAAGVKAIIVVTQGFGDADARGRELQAEMVALARQNGARILGPNTLGVVNNFNRLTTSFMPLVREKSPVGLICQSGVFFVGADNFSGQIGKGIDLGNACDVGFCEALEYLGDDPDIKIIAVHMEGLERTRDFLSLAARVSRTKPVLVYKTGKSETGARAVASHTGSLAGHYRIYEAALRQAGVLFLDEDWQMGEAVRTLLNQPPMPGDRVAVITVTGAGGIMASDALEKYGLCPATLADATIKAVADLSPEWMPLGNPLDLWPAVMRHGLREVYPVALTAVLDDPGVDSVLMMSIAPDLPRFEFLDVSEGVNQALPREKSKPVVAWLYGPNRGQVGRRFEQEDKILVYQSIERAAWSLSLLRERGKFLERIEADRANS